MSNNTLPFHFFQPASFLTKYMQFHRDTQILKSNESDFTIIKMVKGLASFAIIIISQSAFTIFFVFYNSFSLVLKGNLAIISNITKKPILNLEHRTYMTDINKHIAYAIKDLSIQYFTGSLALIHIFAPSFLQKIDRVVNNIIYRVCTLSIERALLLEGLGQPQAHPLLLEDGSSPPPSAAALAVSTGLAPTGTLEGLVTAAVRGLASAVITSTNPQPQPPQTYPFPYPAYGPHMAGFPQRRVVVLTPDALLDTSAAASRRPPLALLPPPEDPAEHHEREAHSSHHHSKKPTRHQKDSARRHKSQKSHHHKNGRHLTTSTRKKSTHHHSSQRSHHHKNGRHLTPSTTPSDYSHESSSHNSYPPYDYYS